jgi:tetratricopeptide (TPR) repeat protein
MARQTGIHIDSPAALGQRLREARLAAGLRQSDLSFDGCSISYISRLEKGERQPSLQLIEQLARRLGVTVEWLARNDTNTATAPEDERITQAEIALRVGATDDALELLLEVLTDDPPLHIAARAEALRGQAAFLADDAETAIDHLERAVDIDPVLAVDPATADTLGRAYARVGQMESAIALFRRNLELARENADSREQLRFAVLLANALIDSTELGEASSILGEALNNTAAEDPLALARIYWTQSRLHGMKRETRLARRFARRALDLLENTEYLQYRSRAHQLMAFAELDAGNAEAALDLIRRGRELAQRSGTAYDEAKFAIEEARALAQLGRLEEAATAAINASKGLDGAHPWDVGRSYTELAEILAQAGQPDRALELFELAIEVLEETPSRFLAEAYTAYGELLERLDRQVEAYEIFKKGAHLQATLQQVSSG